MSKPIYDGGPAFPRIGHIEPNTHAQIMGHPGMLLRDYFAGQALAGWISGPCNGNALDDYDGSPIAFKHHQAHVAETVYGYADAMLAAREAKP